MLHPPGNAPARVRIAKLHPRLRRLALLFLACGATLVLSAPRAFPQSKKAPPAKAAEAGPNDDAIRRAWAFLTTAEQEDALEEYEAEAEYAASFTARLIRFALALEERDRGLLPLEAPIRCFDPLTHAPGQPIPRRELEFDAPAARAERERILGKLPTRRLQVAWRYDYATREVVRRVDAEPLARRFENALAGALPLQDLAEALVERALDDGAQNKTLRAFSHAYTDRSGVVYPGITLYDAWSSGAELEMPDVDVLGIVHTVLDDWKKWKAPVPDSQHKALYDRVGKLFQDARRHRGLRAALARCYLGGGSELEPLYVVCLERFHFAWDEHESDPSKLAKTLPKPDKWNEHLSALDARMLKTAGGRDRARVRIETLEQDSARQRAAWVAILRSRGAFERTARPAPQPPPVPEER